MNTLDVMAQKTSYHEGSIPHFVGEVLLTIYFLEFDQKSIVPA